MLRNATHYRESDALHPERGEKFAICIGVIDPAPVILTMRAPDGSVHRTRLSGGDGPWTETDWYADFTDRAPLGHYVVEARQGSLHASRSFTLEPPDQPVYHIAYRGSKRTTTDVVLLGLRPGERARLSFYRAPDTQGPGSWHADYVTSSWVYAAGDGIATYRFHFNGPTRRCTFYVAKAEVRGRWLDDLNNTTSEFTPPCA